MTITTIEARQQLVDAIADAAGEIGYALASLGAAHEQLDEYSAERLEDELFRPVQAAYGRAKRTHAAFAGRHGLSEAAFEQRSPGLPSTGAKGFIDHAVGAADQADRALATLQDSPLPVDVGDVELRAGLAEVREQLGVVRPRARELVRGLGR
ncbi:MAG: hypothetical protein ACR2GL_05755 [Thermoleophilaceae bacterium]